MHNIESITTRVLGVDAYVVAENTCEIRLINGEVITVETGVEISEIKWDYIINGYKFNNLFYARDYLHTLICEKMSGIRHIYHRKGDAPQLCGYGKACRSKGECDTALCTDCPVAEQFFAERDGVKLEYVVK